jgi:hypothetical protein
MEGGGVNRIKFPHLHGNVIKHNKKELKITDVCAYTQSEKGASSILSSAVSS